MQKKFLNSSLFLGILCFFSMISCSKKIDEAYLNPNAPVLVDIEAILPGVIGSFTAFNSAAGTNYGVQIDDILLGRYIQYWGTTDKWRKLWRNGRHNKQRQYRRYMGCRLLWPWTECE